MSKHVFDLQRFSDNGNSTLSLLFTEKKFECYMLEDEHRKVKVRGETRIDAGVYRLKARKVLTPLTKKYRKRYKWFKYHIEITGLPRHSSTYMHIGNYEKNTDGCPLFGDAPNNNQVKKGFLGSSTIAMKRFYEKWYPIIEDESNEVYINIMDENKIQFHK